MCGVEVLVGTNMNNNLTDKAAPVVNDEAIKQWKNKTSIYCTDIILVLHPTKKTPGVSTLRHEVSSIQTTKMW